MLIERGAAKVNLFLHVGPVKPNGRHDLDSLVVFAGEEAADTVRIEAAEDLSLTVTGPNAAGLETGADNLVLRAAEALRRAGDVEAGAAIELVKHLPIAAGIGGGSADAAAALRGLSQVWGLSGAVAADIAPGLGGDVPAALLSAPCLMRGEGERVAAVEWPADLPAVLVNPGAACATSAVFGAFDGSGGGEGFAEVTYPKFPAGAEGRDALINWLSVQGNDLEAAARQVQPAVAGVLDALGDVDGALLSRMSGSGATCFALFDTIDEAKAVAKALHGERPEWWARATWLGGHAV